MSENVHSRAIGLFPQFVDGELAAEQSAWLGEHLQSCAECSKAWAKFTEIDGRLTAWGERVGMHHPSPADAREALAARLAVPGAPRRTTWWRPAVAAAIAAGMAFALLAPHPREVKRKASAFVEIPYLPPLDPRENAAVVRMNVNVATLAALGCRVAGDPAAMVRADVLVGEDGRAHAVRVLADLDWKETGD